MRIVQLVAENIKKLQAIEITPVSNLVTITGDNGAGKSSVLDCITMALKGGREIPEKPITRGADKGKIVMDMGEFVITRSFTKENSYLKIEPKDGSKVSSPQKFLDDLVGKISFDPLAFINDNDSKQQRNVLLTILGINVDELDKKEKLLREERTIIGRDVTKAKAVCQSSTYYPEVKETTEVSLSDLNTKLRLAMEKNAAREREIASNENLKSVAIKDVKRIEAITEQIATLEAEKTLLTESVNKRKQEYQTTRTRLADAVPIDISSLESEIAGAESINTKIRANVKKATAKHELDQHESQYDSLTQQIEEIGMERKVLLSNATIPVPGLSFDEGGLLYNSIPLDQCSDGEKLMVSLGISMALNPKVRVLRIKDGSLLGQKNIDILTGMIAEKDYQMFFEKVDTSGKIGIYIEEGEIVSIDGEEVEKKEAKKDKVAPPLTLQKAKEETVPVSNTTVNDVDW